MNKETPTTIVKIIANDTIMGIQLVVTSGTYSLAVVAVVGGDVVLI